MAAMWHITDNEKTEVRQFSGKKSGENRGHESYNAKIRIIRLHFYSASALLAMQTAVIATGCLSVRPSRSGVCPDE